jgi:hypothetical protein
MPSMDYCRHENAAYDLAVVIGKWEEYVIGSSLYEDRARTRLVVLAKELIELVEEMEES